MMRHLFVVLALTASTAFGSGSTIGTGGINSKSTGLDGTGIQIGQAEDARSGKAMYDDAGHSASNTIPTKVYIGTTTSESSANSYGDITEHATLVAGIMIGNTAAGTQYEGVAPNAQLYSIGSTDFIDDSVTSFTIYRLTLLNGGAIKTINISAQRALQEFIEEPDGRSQISQFIDWSAWKKDKLYVVSWGNASTSPLFRTPSDNYNGITVAGSSYFDEGSYTKYWLDNAVYGDASGDRTSIDLLAPGFQVQALGFSNSNQFIDGTSFAAAHVSGASALLQEYALHQINVLNPRFGANSQRHEVMKAVMLNSADKISGVNGSGRTILDSNEQDWLQSEAFNDPYVSLDDQLGAGHLNVKRAVQQLSSGEYSPGEFIPKIGWDYGTVGGQGSSVEYEFLEELSAGQYIAITLTWDRRVEHSGVNQNAYSFGDTFFNYASVDDVLNNLDVYLADTTTGTSFLRGKSTTFEDNVEHIFFEVPDTDSYKIIVRNECCGLGTSQNYALTWWYGSGSSAPGDYDKDGEVDSQDYDVWKSNFGTSFADADGNGNGVVDAADYTVWRDNRGAGAGGMSLASVPEPASGMLLIAASLSLATFARRASRSQAAVAA